MNTEILFSFLTDGYAYLQAHAALFGMMALVWVVYPGLITKIFKKL